MPSIKKAAAAVVVISAASACAISHNGSESEAATAKNRQVYVFESDANGFNTKTIFYDNGAEVVAFDAQFTAGLAEQAIAFLRTQTASPIKYLVITHPNPDKFNGLGVFKDIGAKVVASKATAAAMPGVHAYKKNFFVNVAKMFTDDNYPVLGTVDIAFDDRLDLQLDSGERINLSELSGPGVSSSQTVAFISSVNALVVGDLIHHHAHAWLEGGIVDGMPTPTIDSWIKDIEELSTRFGGQNPTVYGGRGMSSPLSEVAPAQINYLQNADRIVGDYVASLNERRAELMGAESQAHYANIQKMLETAFPTYTLSYMIGYGVYGLALSK